MSIDERTTQQTIEILRRFNDAFLHYKPNEIDALVGEECTIENTAPAPDGARHVGRKACLEVWHAIASNRDGKFNLESVEAYGERGIIRWRYSWGPNTSDAVRGVNLMRVRDGQIVEGMGYVKGA